MRRSTVLSVATILHAPLAGSSLIEASAGTGKTFTIANLYLRLVLEGRAVDRLLVVTFTVAATDELRGRIRQRLYAGLQALVGDSAQDALVALWCADHVGSEARLQAQRRLKLALRSMDEAAIFTIHGFCQRVLTEHAFNSGKDFEVEMLTDDGVLWDQAIKDWWRRTVYPLDAASLALFHAAVGRFDALRKLQQPLRRPGVVLVPQVEASLDDLFIHWRDWLARCQQLGVAWHRDRERLAKALASGALMQRRKVYKLANIPDLLAAIDGYFASERLFVGWSLLASVAASTLQSQLKKKQSETFDQPFFVAVERIVDAAEALQRDVKLRALAEVNAAAARQVAQAKREASQMAFDDQLLQLEAALAASPALVAAIGARYPVAMIDEFQDTDAIQYSIFSQIYHLSQGVVSNGVATESMAIMLIGDPKQAIYSFRGGDIFTYLRAKQEVDRSYTLDTNWRSTPQLIAAVNTLFAQRAQPFLYAEIAFQPVHPAPQLHRPLTQQGREMAAMTLWHLTATEGKQLGKVDLREQMHGHTANEIVRLIEAGRRGDVTLGDLLQGGRALLPGDIAVLVRNHIEADGLREALRQRGVPAVAAGTDGVFSSSEAAGLLLLLRAVINWHDGATLRQALASPLLNLDYAAMQAWTADEARWLGWSDTFRGLHTLWLQRGFMAMFQQMLRELALGERLAAARYPERSITNLLHLGELLQQASATTAGMDGLLRWLIDQRDRTDEESVLRLEHDAALVRIVTIHASKGLQYPVVFLPYIWDCRTREREPLLPYFDEDRGVRCLDAGSEQRVEHLCCSERERLAEDVRLLYVALTRAESKLYLGWCVPDRGRSPHTVATKTAAAWLLHPHQQVEDLDAALPDALAAKNGDAIDDDLARLVAAGQGAIELRTISTEEVSQPCILAPLAVATERSGARSFTGKIATDWRITSFTALTREVHQPILGGARVAADAVLGFPAGSRTGLFLHQLLENLDFTTDVVAQTVRLSLRLAPRFGLDPDCGALVGRWISDVVQTPLNGDDLRLADIAPEQRMNELAFDFSMAKLDVSALNALLAQAAPMPIQGIRVEACRGVMTGLIDLVFFHHDRYFLVDYKSNLLGGSLSDYTPEKLETAIYTRRYDLQYLLYTVALQRYLRLRLADYDYDRHIGGVYYLFLRGMRPDSDGRQGVYAHRPTRSLIDGLDTLLAAAG
ncbi:MAG: exodeoxyribonuclease V subunit beta [Mariprofundales bacterium]|nr:exodeoxyribonuclease V subunit beta [Mariprofundales bacterium]